MTTNKIIFIVLAAIIGIIILFVTFTVRSGDWKVERKAPGDVSVWIQYDDPTVFSRYIEGFKEANPSYKSKNILIESFSDNDLYTKSFISALVDGQAPDLFVLSNESASPIENQALGIDPNIVSPNDFRQRFHTRFSDDLIITDEADESVEFLKGVPLWYELPVVFYSRKYFLRPSELETWWDFAKEVKSISEKHSKIVPFALGNTAWVRRFADIIKALFVLEDTQNIYDLKSNHVQSAFWLYESYYQKNGDNGFAILSDERSKRTDINFFTEGEAAAMIGFPRDLIDINEIGFQKSFLFAAPFPQYLWWEKRVPISYNYLAVNKDSPERETAYALMAYIYSQEWQQAYINTFPYYLSPELSVAEEIKEKKVLPQYNIVYKNFVDADMSLVSYDLGDRSEFEKYLEKSLALWWSNAISEFTASRENIVCRTTKYTTLLNLSSPCE